MIIFKLIPVVFAIGGCVFIGFGVAVIRNARRFAAHAVRVPGVVVDLIVSRRTTTSGSTTSFHPVLAFTTVDGRPVQTRSPIGSSPAPARRGERVTVLYDPRNPGDARVDNVRGRGGCLGPFFIVFGSVFAFFGVMVAIVAFTW